MKKCILSFKPIQVIVVVDSGELAFEQDKAGGYNPVVDHDFINIGSPEPGLIEVICQRLNYLFKPGHRKKMIEQKGLQG